MLLLTFFIISIDWFCEQPSPTQLKIDLARAILNGCDGFATNKSYKDK